jgi:hypothetical protein
MPATKMMKVKTAIVANAFVGLVITPSDLKLWEGIRGAPFEV